MKSPDVRPPEMPIAIHPFLHDVEVSPDEQSIERALKLALRRLPENERLSLFAHAITSPLPHAAKAALWRVIRERFSEEVPVFTDVRGNGILWYLTYRTDQQTDGGFACPQTVETLISLGADPCLENELGLCWNDVSRHFVR